MHEYINFNYKARKATEPSGGDEVIKEGQTIFKIAQYIVTCRSAIISTTKYGQYLYNRKEPGQKQLKSQIDNITSAIAVGAEFLSEIPVKKMTITEAKNHILLLSNSLLKLYDGVLVSRKIVQEHVQAMENRSKIAKKQRKIVVRRKGKTQGGRMMEVPDTFSVLMREAGRTLGISVFIIRDESGIQIEGVDGLRHNEILYCLTYEEEQY